MDNECNFCKMIDECVIHNNFSHAYLIETNDNIYFKDYVNYFLNKISNSAKFIDFFDNQFKENFIKISKDDGIIKKEQISNLQNSFNKKSDGDKMIYLIEDASKFNLFSANSILKFLEEPPAGVYAILVVSNKNLVIPTILSRCVVTNLPICNLINKDIDLFDLSIIEMLEKFQMNSFLEYNKVIDFKKITRDEFLNKLLEMRSIFEYIKDNNFIDKEVNEFYLYLKDKSVLFLLEKINLINIYIKKVESNVNLNLLFDSFIIDYCGVK